MNILTHKLTTLTKLLSLPTQPIYIHLKDHDKKINPSKAKLNLSYMDPQTVIVEAPKHTPYAAVLKITAEEALQKKLFEDYKEKILEGKVDEEEILEADTLWGEGEKPSHFFKELSATQISHLSHSIFNDIESYQEELANKYLSTVKNINHVSETKDINDLAELAANLRKNGITNREQYFEIEKSIGNKFHLLTDRSLILLKYAFITSPRLCTPEFNNILCDLLADSIPKLSGNDLTYLMYFNRFDHFKIGHRNIQISIFNELENHYPQLSLEEKIDFLILYIDSRGPAIRKQSHNRHVNEIRNKVQEVLYQVNLDGDFSELSWPSVFKLAYVLLRGKTNVTDFISEKIVLYVDENLESIPNKELSKLFYYFSQIESGKAVRDRDALGRIKDKVLASWSELETIDQLRTLDSILTLNFYDESIHELYTSIPIQASNSELALFCRLEIMNSSGREWEVIHRLSELPFVPLAHFQDYKRFYNYVSVIAQDWDLKCIKEKLENTEIFHNVQRQESLSLDKRFYSQIRKFQQFSHLKHLPKPFKMGVAIKNVEFVEFALPEYQISLDVITDVERIRGTQELKGNYNRKIKSLENIGWKHLYVFEEDIQTLNPIELFDYIYSVCEQHFEEQLQLVASYEEYRAYELELLREESVKIKLKPQKLEKFLLTKDINILYEEEDEEEEQLKKLAKLTNKTVSEMRELQAKQ